MRRDAGGRLDDDAALLLMARHVLGGPTDEGRASYQLALTVCEACARATQTGRGEALQISAEVAEMASCDAQHIKRVHAQSRSGRDSPTKNQGGRNMGSGDEIHVRGEATCSGEPPITPLHARVAGGERQLPAGSRRQRASQTIPPAIRRAVLLRDQHCCQVPGCRHATFVDVHHLRARENGANHEPDNLLTLCGAHHRACHRGELRIEKNASGGLTFWHADGTGYGRGRCADEADVAARTLRGLRNLGFGEREAREAVREAGAHVGTDGGVESLMRTVLDRLTRDSWGKAS